jgi:hypothetical protein
MHTLKRLWLKIIHLAKRVWFPHGAATSFTPGPQPVALSYTEAERLDRIRHPSKYLGK